ncbi:hypothetical protein RZ78_03880 [Apilactobacillus kunkeei]|uniref:Uncharacterized protein n=1 Tax=Apilactobacillus kunkeei TaxID=148814 RepID=A0A0P7KAL4_9LACO|nr:hypothetical protein RZ78_03880 [Apilactobacillus kunkeei]
MDAEATKVKQEIDADNSLTSSEKATQKSNVDSEKSTYQGKIDEATNADDIKTASQQGIKDIDAQYVAGKTSVADQKSNAKAQLDAEATKVKQKIDADNTLTSDEKAKQKANVYSTKSIDQTAIDMATNADDINTAWHKGIQDIDNQYIPGKTSLADQKANAKSQLDAQAAKIKSDIENDATLTQNQKNDQMNQLAAHKVAAEQAIDNAADADGINKALDDGNSNMAEDHQPGQAIDNQKASAKQAIQAEANKVKAAIAADSSLTSEEKDNQNSAVDSAFAAAQSNIDRLTNADDINTAKKQGITDVDGKHVSGTPLDTQKSTAKSQITNEANKIKQDIANDATLTQAQKDAQTAKVNADADAASKAIDNASDADSVNKAISDGTSNIDADHTSKAPVDSQRSDALNQLDEKAAKVKQDIANDATLTQAQKDAQTAKVDADAAAGKQAIQNATDADSINKALSDNSGQIAKDHQPGSSVDNQKDSNNTNLDAEATKVKNQIDADVSLTGKEKDQQKSNVESVKAAAEAKINAATNADGIKAAYDQGIKDIDAQYVPGKTSLPDQKANAKAQLDAQAAKIKQDIANDATLTQSQKDAQMAKVDADRQSAESAIDNAKDADGVNQAISDWNGTIEKDHQPGKPIADQKADAKAAIQAEADKVKAAIDADPTLTSDEKADQKNKVDSVSSAEQAKIDGLTNVDDIHNQITQSVSDIDDVHQSGESLADQKAAAKSQLDAQAAKIKQDIANDVTLTQADKDAQSAKVDADTNAGKQAIDNAADADSINSLIKDNKDKIAADHVLHASVDDQKASNKKTLDDQAAKVKQDIANDNTLTQAEKDAQTAKVEADKEAAEKAIDAALDAEGVKKATDAGNDKINGDHVPGESVDDQKAAAKKQLDDQAAKIKQDIANDTTLTQAEKDAQSAKVDADRDAGEKAIDGAINADDINKLISDTTGKINVDHTSGQAVADQKTAKKNDLDTEANKVKAAIDADNTLSQAEKDAQKAAIDADVNAGKKAIDAASNAEGIKQAVDSTNQKIDGEHHSGKSVADQKNDAKSQMDAEADKVKAAIDADDTLTGAEKAQQKKNVDDANKAAQAKIDDASNADEINGAIKDGNTNIDGQHKSGTSVKDQQDAAKKQLDDQAAKIKNDIQNDVTLTSDQKKEQTDKVDADKTAAEKAVSAATNADDINKAISNGNDKISNDHQSGTSLDKQKSDAKNAVDAAAKSTKDKIDSDNTLTSAEKEAQKNKVDSEAEDTKKNIDAATNADDINDLSDRMIGNVDNNYAPGTPLSDQKSAAKKQLSQKLDDLIKQIFDDDTLTTDQKNAQKAQATSDMNEASNAVDNAKDADSINKAVSDGNGKINADHKPGTSVDDQKSAAKQQLEAQAAKTKQDIQNDATLTQAQRDAQVAKVDADKTAAEKAVDDATDADSINKAIADGNNNISNDHQSGTSVDTQKDNAKAQLDAEATKVKSDIDADNSLTSDEKDVQKAKVDADVKAGKEAIDNATEADNINKAVSDTNAQVDKEHVPGTPVDSQKSVAKKQLEDQATKIKQDITNDATLTQAEKEAQIAKVEADKTAGEKAIDDAKNADTINQALVDSNNSIVSDHVPGKSLTDQKDAAKKQLDAEADKTKATIDADKTLTSAEKAQQKANVDAKNKAAQDNVDAQTNADNINAMTAQGVEEIDAQYVPGKVSLSDQKTNAKAKLEGEATKVKNDILNDATLTKAEKDTQMAQVDADKAAGEKAIEDALDADGINQAVSDSNAKMDADYVPGKTSLPDQKSNAKAQLDAQAAKIKNDIANDATLTQAEKDAQMAQVDADKAAAEQAIDNAPDADSINQAISNGNTKIASDYVPGKPVDDQKSAAKADLDAKAAKVKNDIANDATLTQSEKDTQMAKVDADKAASEQAIDNATNADSINQIISDTNAKIDADHVAGQSLDAQRSAAKARIEEEANKVRAAIDADKTLSSAEKARQKKNLERAKVNAEAEIDSSRNADTIKARILPQLHILDIQHVKKQNNGSGPEQTIPRNVYMVKNFYRYLSTTFTKKNRVQGYKATSRPNAVMFRIIGETTNKNGVKRYKVYQIVVKKNGSFKVDRKKWGYITAKPSYMRPLYYRSNVQQIKVIGKGIREYKNVKLSKAVKGYKHGTVLKVKAVKKYGSTYRLQLTNGHYITANKNLVRKQTTPRNVYMVKGFYRYSSVNFSHKNRIQGYKKQARPNAVMFRIVGETTNKNGLKRYKVYQIVRNKKGLFRVDHKKWGYITTKPSYVKPLYYSSKVRSVRVIGSRIRAYKNVKLTKSVKSYKRGTVLNVKAVNKIGTTYRLQLTNGSYISANKNLVQKIK